MYLYSKGRKKGEWKKMTNKESVILTCMLVIVCLIMHSVLIFLLSSGTNAVVQIIVSIVYTISFSVYLHDVLYSGMGQRMFLNIVFICTNIGCFFLDLLLFYKFKIVI